MGMWGLVIFGVKHLLNLSTISPSTCQPIHKQWKYFQGIAHMWQSSWTLGPCAKIANRLWRKKEEPLWAARRTAAASSLSVSSCRGKSIKHCQWKLTNPHLSKWRRLSITSCFWRGGAGQVHPLLIGCYWSFDIRRELPMKTLLTLTTWEKKWIDEQILDSPTENLAKVNSVSWLKPQDMSVPMHAPYTTPPQKSLFCSNVNTEIIFEPHKQTI